MSIPRRSLSPYTHTHTRTHTARSFIPAGTGVQKTRRFNSVSVNFRERHFHRSRPVLSPSRVYSDLPYGARVVLYTRFTARDHISLSLSLSRSLAPRASKQLDRIKRGGPLLALFSDPKLVNSLSAPMRGSERERAEIISLALAKPCLITSVRIAWPSQPLPFSSLSSAARSYILGAECLCPLLCWSPEELQRASVTVVCEATKFLGFGSVQFS